MRKILIVGAGQAGLQLANGLAQSRYDVTVVSNRTPEQIHDGRVLSSQCMFDRSLQHERDLGLDFWESECPAVEGLSFSVPAPDGNGKAIFFEARLDRPAQSVDQRLKMPRWLEELEGRGGRVELHEASADDLERYADENDLVIIAAGKGEVARLFERDAERSSAPTATPPPPNPPATIAGMDRFIALAIRLVRIEPEAPTIMPATIIALLFSANPAAAADNPVIAFSNEMTTGISAPPIGSTTIRPSTAAAASSPTIHHSDVPPPAGMGIDADHDGGDDRSDQQQPVQRLLRPAEPDRPAGQDLLQFPERDERAPERDRPDDGGEQRRHHDVHGRRLAVLEVRKTMCVNQLRQRDQRDSATTHAVVERHQLRHRRHLTSRAGGTPSATRPADRR